MRRAFASEWTRITRAGYLIGFGGTIVGLSVLFAGLILSLFTAAPTDTAGPARTMAFEGSSGAVASLFFTLGIMGAAALVLGALAVASEYTHGTLRVMLVAHPQRWSYLAGKIGALWALVGILVLTAAVLQVGVAALIMESRGGDTSAWWALEGLRTIAGAIGRVVLITWAWVLIGVLLATLLRNAAAAIGIGIGYSIIVEPLLGVIFDHTGPFLPAAALSAFANGGGAVLSLWEAALLVALYAAAFVALSLYVFDRRDVGV